MQLDKYLIGLLLFSVIISTGALMMADLNTNYAAGIDTSSYDGNLTVLDETYDEIIDTQKDATLGKEIDDDDTPNSMFAGAYSAIRLLKNSFGLTGGIINSIATELGIPKIFIKLATGAITLLVIFSLIYLIFRFKS